MTKNYYAQGATEPTLFITKGRQRVKQYDDNIVYLKNGDEFEFELFNPKSNKVLAKIKLNGTYFRSGIVLRPGERVFLERYLDEARKFKFETYEVDSSDVRIRDAIRNNGDVEVEFYDEAQPSPSLRYNYYWPETHYHYHSHYTSQPEPTPTWTMYGGTGGLSIGSSETISSTSSSSSITNAGYCCTNSVDVGASKSAVREPVETGRVEKGDISNQALNTDYSSFNSWMCNKVVWKILPESQRPYVREDLSVYCTNCGAKRKKSSHKFCPNCGTKF
jgi:hypothetical protein